MAITRDHPPSDLVVVRDTLTEAELAEIGVDIERDFPGSTADDFRRYPVLTEGGWHMVVKHQPTLTSVWREPWELLGPIRLTSHGFEL
ncbi:hypothetical protein [uncultured Aeromicrobium sp.]|uniref:hypothetical protein n=1 Tax=uncultured Aeromicrobium sp. TaxID=337820 RepID=UPI0025CE1F81|nr:hypothetical protein [uncultured Aeromicrobium sp.]